MPSLPALQSIGANGHTRRHAKVKQIVKKCYVISAHLFVNKESIHVRLDDSEILLADCETHVCQLLLSIYKTHLLHVAGFGNRRSFNIKLQNLNSIQYCKLTFLKQYLSARIILLKYLSPNFAHQTTSCWISTINQLFVNSINHANTISQRQNNVRESR